MVVSPSGEGQEVGRVRGLPVVRSICRLSAIGDQAEGSDEGSADLLSKVCGSYEGSADLFSEVCGSYQGSADLLSKVCGSYEGSADLFSEVCGSSSRPAFRGPRFPGVHDRKAADPEERVCATRPLGT